MKSSRMSYLMTDDKAKKIFEFVATKRTVVLGEIIKLFAESWEPDITKSTLERLESLELLSKTPASIEELSTWFVTASGLSAERELKRYGAS